MSVSATGQFLDSRNVNERNEAYVQAHAKTSFALRITWSLLETALLYLYPIANMGTRYNHPQGRNFEYITMLKISPIVYHFKG